MTKVPSQYTFQNKFWMLVFVLIVSVGGYLSFFGLTIYHTLERQKAERQVSELATRVSELEFSYLTKKASINADLARSLGFVEAPEAHIAHEKEDVLTLR